MHKVYGVFKRNNEQYLQQELKYSIVAVKSEEFGNSLGVEDFEGSI